MEAISLGKKEEGIASLEQAAKDEPRNPEIKAALLRNKDEQTNTYLAEAERQRVAGRLDAAE